MAKKTRTFLFEGVERTTADIRQTFFPGVPHGTLYTRLIVSGATTRVEYMAYLTGGVKKSTKADTDGKRFSRKMAARTEQLVGERGCSYCQQMKPVSQLSTVTTFNRHKSICDACKAQRAERMNNPIP